ncbi:unnamed protein product [Orchesella dallaii]
MHIFKTFRMGSDPSTGPSLKVIAVLSIILIFLVNLSLARKYYPRSPDEESNVTSEGMWQRETALSTPPKVTQGASRFDVGGILTTFGMKQGASVFALVVFPILFPLMILLGLAMFIISMVGAGGVAVAGKRSDTENSLASTSGGYYAAGYKTDRYGYPITVTNRDGLAFDVVENDTCMERFVCEILLRGGSTMIGKKMTLE